MDPEERRQRDRELFDRIAETYATKDLRAGSRLARRHRLLASTAELPALGRVLEVGCGAGFSAEYLRGRYDSYVGLDYSAELIDFARERHQHANVSFECAPVEEFECAQRFDTVLMIGVLHHMADPVAALRRLASWLTPGGQIVANEPQKGNPMIGLARAVRKRIDPRYSEDQIEFSRRELLATFESAGLEASCFAQGVLSTPFAEVVLPLGALTSGASRLACELDQRLDRLLNHARLERWAWNLVIVGQLAAR